MNDDIKMSIVNAKVTWMEALAFLRNPPKGYQIHEWKFFNGLVGGLREKEFTVLCGATGIGKTSLLANISASLVTSGIKHFVASVETGAIDFSLRVASVLGDEDLCSGDEIPPAKTQELEVGMDTFFGIKSKNCLYFSTIEDRMSVEFLCEKLTYANQILGCKVAMIDNLNFFLEVTSVQNSIIEMDRVIHELILLVKKIDMHVIMVMHPKKTENGRVESEYDIKGSSTAVQEAQNVFLFNRLKPETMEHFSYTPNHRELTIQKMRRRGRYVGRSIIFDGTKPCYREVGMT